jgi:poly-beta-hydroxyalkanoate depolymerase
MGGSIGSIDTRLNPTALDLFTATHGIDRFRSTVIDTVSAGYRGAGRTADPPGLRSARRDIQRSPPFGA